MRNRHEKSKLKNKLVFLTNDEEAPDGFVEVAGVGTGEYEIRVAIPKVLLRDPKNANQFIREAYEALLRSVSQ
jgi:hypothetical protein